METQNPPVAATSPAEPPARKPYEAPQLQVYGDLIEITGGQLGGSMQDGAAHPNRHFTA
jgi:hypothetical protein